MGTTSPVPLVNALIEELRRQHRNDGRPAFIDVGIGRPRRVSVVEAAMKTGQR